MPKIVDHGSRRDEIAKAAVRVMAARGLEALTLRDIAEENGSSPAILTHYFRGRDEILLHASSYLREASRRRQLESITSAERIEDAIARELPVSDAIRDEWKTRFQVWARSAVDQDLGEDEATSFERWRRDTVELLEERGLLPSGAESEVLADHVVALSVGLCVMAFFDPDTFDVDRASAVVRQAFNESDAVRNGGR